MPPTRKALMGSSIKAAATMAVSFKYKWPPGTGMPKEDNPILMAIRRPQMVSHRVLCLVWVANAVVEIVSSRDMVLFSFMICVSRDDFDRSYRFPRILKVLTFLRFFECAIRR